MLPTPTSATKEVAFATNVHLIYPDGKPIKGKHVSSIRQGVPQGAQTSAAIALWIMTFLEPELSNQVHLIVYADNLFLVGPTRQEVEAAAKFLAEAVASLPGGPYVTKPPIFSSAEKSIYALGHEIRLCNGQVYDWPNQSNQEAYEANIAEGLERAAELHAKYLVAGEDRWLAYVLAELAGLRRYVNMWKKSFKDSPYESHLEQQDPVHDISVFMKKHGINSVDLKGWENGKIRVHHNPSNRRVAQSL
ncbi:hypothetical protein [Ruegeria sp. SCP11]|uniref:hypothetical protein n=1 Tax=Ruegeria sp. SCP11 TaxID=3141378 RepID=UPI0033377556